MKTIKAILATAACVALVATASAQNFTAAKVGIVEENGVTTLSHPQTTLTVNVVVEKQITVVGPYARFAQKYLGARAALTDKVSYSIVDAAITAADTAPATSAPEFTEGSEVVSLRGSAEEFPKVLPNKLSSTEIPLETAAQEAANTIFKLRKVRIELVSGDVGENVYGAGLKAALDEINRLEQEYLELFLGKQVVTRTVKTISIVPEAAKTKYIICRFSEQTGIEPANNLSAQPIVLELVPSGKIPTEGLTLKSERDTRYAVPFRVADNVVCRLSDSRGTLTEIELPIFQYGQVVEIVNTQKK
jgi:hypothetical protein